MAGKLLTSLINNEITTSRRQIKPISSGVRTFKYQDLSPVLRILDLLPQLLTSALSYCVLSGFLFQLISGKTIHPGRREQLHGRLMPCDQVVICGLHADIDEPLAGDLVVRF
jgi:hypothetical protein